MSLFDPYIYVYSHVDGRKTSLEDTLRQLRTKVEMLQATHEQQLQDLTDRHDRQEQEFLAQKSEMEDHIEKLLSAVRHPYRWFMNSTLIHFHFYRVEKITGNSMPGTARTYSRSRTRSSRTRGRI